MLSTKNTDWCGESVWVKKDEMDASHVGVPLFEFWLCSQYHLSYRAPLEATVDSASIWLPAIHMKVLDLVWVWIGPVTWCYRHFLHELADG